MSSGDSPSPAELTFPGDGEMALRMRAFPWATSPLGDPRDSPASLRTACRICLTSRFPMIVWWGEELRLAARRRALGRDVIAVADRPDLRAKSVFRSAFSMNVAPYPKEWVRCHIHAF